MENRFFDKVEDNTAVRIWAETTQQEKCDSLTEGCFTFEKIHLVLTIEEYTALLRCPKIQVNIIYSKAANGLAFSKRLMNITGMSEQWVTARIKQKGGCRCIHWRNLRDLILAHPDIKKRVDVFALRIYGLVIFSKALGHIDEAVSDLFDRLIKGTTPVLAILAETFRSSNACRRVGEGRFIGCAQLLLSWFHSHFWKVEKNLQEENVEWRALWMVYDEILYRYRDFD
ncbi:hypothetical protein CXB51_024754 [Gossypium anomalum]|uniref:DUF7745 domain-containing protein n=1 Tax=Gossypium anomalum TaxID=47600 RepID=A0A8J5Y2Q2_9ROSI|nr:hypothetical protein CXB51_024754 [Gossypium anomalum]